MSDTKKQTIESLAERTRRGEISRRQFAQLAGLVLAGRPTVLDEIVDPPLGDVALEPLKGRRWVATDESQLAQRFPLLLRAHPDVETCNSSMTSSIITRVRRPPRANLAPPVRPRLRVTTIPVRMHRRSKCVDRFSCIRGSRTTGAAEGSTCPRESPSASD